VASQDPGKRAQAARSSAAAIAVPRAPESPTIDGRLTEPLWQRAAVTFALTLNTDFAEAEVDDRRAVPEWR
jgi:hypothetical protein